MLVQMVRELSLEVQELGVWINQNIQEFPRAAAAQLDEWGIRVMCSECASGSIGREIMLSRIYSLVNIRTISRLHTSGSDAAIEWDIVYEHLGTKANSTSRARSLQPCVVSHGNTRAAASHKSYRAIAAYDW